MITYLPIIWLLFGWVVFWQARKQHRLSLYLLATWFWFLSVICTVLS